MATTAWGHAVAAIDPAAFGEIEEFKANVDKLIRSLRASERMPGVERIWMPGEQSHGKRMAQNAQGIALAPQLMKTLAALADELGIETLQEN